MIVLHGGSKLFDLPPSERVYYAQPGYGRTASRVARVPLQSDTIASSYVPQTASLAVACVFVGMLVAGPAPPARPDAGADEARSMRSLPARPRTRGSCSATAENPPAGSGAAFAPSVPLGVVGNGWTLNRPPHAPPQPRKKTAIDRLHTAPTM